MHLIDHEADGQSAVPIGKLERSKAKRRAAIIGAALEIIRETGETGLSMRALAARAGVSLATPYNLFGSKQAILVALLAQNAIAFGKVFQEKASSDQLTRIFDYVDLSFDLYRSDPTYYQALLRTLYRSEDAQLRTSLRKPRANFLKTLLRDAMTAGYLEPDLAVELVSRDLFGIYLYSVQEWVHGSVTLDRARLETGHGYSLILLGAALDHARPELLSRRNRLQAQIVSLSAAAAPATSPSEALPA